MVAVRSLDVTALEPRIVLHAGGDPLVVPGGNALLTAEFQRLGPDLLIHGQHGGTEVLVHDYFAANHTPTLMTESGLRLDGELVTALARPEGYLQFAQDQTAQADTNGGAQPIGKVDSITGSVEVHHTDGSTAQLAQGAPVFQGDVIQTGADGQIGVTFVDGTAFSLESGARMTLDDLVYSADGKNNSFSASVLQGTFVFMAGKIAPSGHMEVKTPVGTIGIRGTTVGGHLSMDGNDNTIVLFRDAKTGHVGKVEFTNAGGTQVLDGPNSSTHVTSFFAPPSRPIPLPPQDAQQYFNDMLQHFYDQHGGAPSGNQGNNGQPGQPTADQLADQMDLENFNTAAGPGAHNDGGNGHGGSHDPLSGLLGFVPPLPTTVAFTTLSLTGGLLFGPNSGFGDFGGQGHITQDNLGQTNQNSGFTTINGGPGNDTLGLPANGSTGGGGSPTPAGPLHIFGNAGDDVLTGSSFDDQIHGGAGNDILDGGAGNDQVFGDTGNDTFDGGTGLGNDYYDGGDGVDTVEYSSATMNITVNLTTGTASGDPDIGSDTLINIENVIGGSGNDTIIGSAADNVLYGGAGNDTLEGLGGNDTLIGGIPSTGDQPPVASGVDVAVFRGDLAQYTVNETEGGAFIVSDSVAGRDGTDTLIDITNVRFADGEFSLSDLVNRPPSTPADADTATPNQVAENAANGTAVGITANSIDPNGHTVTYSLVGDTSNGGFQIDPNTGIVTVADGSKIDFETAPGHDYQITVQANDGSLTSQNTTFTIGVTNVNEPPSAPADADTTHANQVAENAATGTVVGITAASTDPDGDHLTYSLVGDTSNGGFQIDANTGVVTVADGSKIDYETAPGHDYQITVQASDGSLNTQTSFTIGVGNEPPSAPVDANASANTVQENAATGTAVGITAAAADPAGGAVTYSLVGDTSNGGFQIDGTTGVVTVADGSKIDYETASSHAYQITVQASDGSLNTQTTFNIGVGNEPPSAPVDANASANTVQENAATGTAVGITAAAADPAGGAVTYSLVGDTSNGGFQIDGTTGVVTVADGSKIDYETAPGHDYQITVQASDGSLTNQSVFTIGVGNEPPSAPADANASANTVQENAETGTVVGITAAATDPAGGAVTYSLVGDTSNGGFQIDGTTGVVTVADGSKIDYETAPGHDYQITVQASDGSLNTQTSFTIGVGNEPPSAPVDANASANTVQENAATGTAVGITAASADPAGGAVTYSLVGDSSNGGFQIDANTGVVTVADGSKIDYETAPGHDYQITVQASDGSLNTQTSFTIGVGNEPPSAPVDANASANTVQERAETGTAVSITASSSDPAGGAVTYSLVGDSSNGGFKIDGTTGVVTVADGSKIDYDTASGHAYEITVEASDGTLVTDSTFTIQVQPAPPPSIDLDANNSSGDTTTGYKTSFSGQPVTVTDSDTVVTAAPGVMITSATLQLTGVTNQAQEKLVAGSGLPAGISVSSFTYSNGVGTLTLSGAASAADYAAALEAIKYQNSAGGQAAGSRTVTVTVTDDVGHVSNAATTLINVAAAPTIIGDVINGDPLIIGNIGHGEVDLFAGGIAAVHQIIIGNFFTGNGLLQLDPGSTAGLGANTVITVGNAGIGQLSVTGTAAAPSEVDAGQMIIGAQGSGVGTVSLHAGSELNVTGGTIAVGERGVGFLTIQGTSTAPSTAIANQVVIGDQDHSGGVVQVNGSGSSLVTQGTDNGIIVGNHGSGFLGVTNGGQVETLSLEIGRDGSGSVIIGDAGTKVLVSNETGNFSGDDSNEAGFVRVGKTDDGNGSLSVVAGALLAIEAGITTNTGKTGATLMIADEIGSQGNVVIDGVHSTIALSQTSTTSTGLDTKEGGPFVSGPTVIVGHEGDATLTVQNQGLLSVTGQGASIEIGAGDNDPWWSHLPQSVATVSSGGQITLTDNSNSDDPHVAAGGLTIGGDMDGNGKLVVTGAGSMVTVQSIDGATIGDAGTGTLTITAGGLFRIQSHAGATQQSGLTIARNETANGNVTVSGTGSQLQILSPNIAGLMDGPFLIMAAGQSLFQVADHANVLIQGEGANFVVGNDADSLAQASIVGGATMTVDGKDGDATVVVASQAGSNGSLTIDGTNSHLTITGDSDQMLIGAAYNGNQDIVTDKSGDADVKVSNGGILEVGPTSTHGSGPAEIVIGEHGSLDISNGTVIGDVSDQGGEISIGHNAIAAATLIGNLDMSSPSSTLDIDASGASAGHADKLNVTGDVNLTAATVNFNFLGNYAPHAGDTFSFLTASGTVTANPADISLVAHDVSSSFRFELLTTEHDIQFHALTNAGTGSSDVFLGGDKNDTFTATGNNNALFGGAGDDTLIGGNTGNFIQGGAGADHMVGGKGADTFSFVLPSDGVQVSNNATVASDSSSYDHISNFNAQNDTISFASGYGPSSLSSIGTSNFSTINTAYNGTNGTSAAFNSGQASFILDGNNNLIYDGNGKNAGYTIVAHIDVAPGSPAITAHNLHMA